MLGGSDVGIAGGEDKDKAQESIPGRGKKMLW